jgi:hypothetical protein
MKGKILLGWLTRERAVARLMTDCIFDPPLTNRHAESLWAEKRAAVEGLGPRPAPSPKTLEMTPLEREASAKFLAFARRQPGGTPQIQSVVKIDPRGLVCQQFLITLDQANAYLNNIHADSWSVDHCLTVHTSLAGINVAEVPNGWNFNLPHGEFMFAFNGQVFGVTECAPYVSVSFIKGRTVLWTGYHRCYARVANAEPATMDCSVLAVVTTKGDAALAGNQPLRDQLLGDRPPVVRDFLDERLCLDVEVRRKRYELQVRAEVAQINAE